MPGVVPRGANGSGVGVAAVGAAAEWALLLWAAGRRRPGQLRASSLAVASWLDRTGLRMTNRSSGEYARDPAAAP